MFRLLKKPADLTTYINELWIREGNSSPYTNGYNQSYKYPCLATAVLNYNIYDNRPLFTCIYCFKNGAKRLVYPSTNKNRSIMNFRFAENYDALWGMIDMDSIKSNAGHSPTQSSIIDKVHQLVELNGSFPALYAFRNITISRETRLFRPIVLPLYMAKKLVYLKPLKKSKITIAPWRSAQEVIGTQPIVQTQPPDAYIGPMVVNLAVNAPGVIRFMPNREQDFLFREQHKLDKMNRELDGDLENVGNDRYKYIKNALVVFTDWRESERRIHARRYPREVLHDRVNQNLLRRTVAEHCSNPY